VQVRAPRVVKGGHRAKGEFLGGSRATGTGLGGPPSSTCLHNRETKTSLHGPERPRCNSCYRIFGTSEQRSRTSDPSAPSSRTAHRPRGRHDSCISRHPVPVHQHRHSIRLHDRRYF
jgi:hypothetical protein